MFKKYAFIVALLSSFVLTNISYADCTDEEIDAKARFIIDKTIMGQISSSDMDDIVSQADEAALLAYAGKLNEACQKYDDSIVRYNLNK